MPWLPALDVTPLQATSPCPELDRSDSSADSPWDIRALHRGSTPFREALNAQSPFEEAYRTPSPPPQQVKQEPQRVQAAKSAFPEQQGFRSTRLRMSTRQQQQRQLAGGSPQVLTPHMSTASSSARLLRKRAARLELRGAQLVLAEASNHAALEGQCCCILSMDAWLLTAVCLTSQQGHALLTQCAQLVL